MSNADWIAILGIVAGVGTVAIGGLGAAIWRMHTDLTVVKSDVKWMMKSLGQWKYVFKSLLKSDHDSDEPGSDEAGGDSEIQKRW